MIRFIYGAGSDATRQLLTESILQDLADGFQAILLVPEQETVITERRMLESLPATAQLSFEVLNFSRLANRTFRAIGGLSYHLASPAVSALLMWKSLREVAPLLQQYGADAAKDSALCELMLKTHAQCKACCITADDLLSTADSLPVGDPLRDKLHDIGLTLGTFEAAFGTRFDNSDDELTRLAAALAGDGKQLFANTHIYLDSFTDFTAQEQAVLEQLMRIAPTLSITFPLSAPTEKGLHLKAIQDSHDTLFAMAKKNGLRIMREVPEQPRPSDSISYISAHLFDMGAEPAPLSMLQDEKIQVISCSSPFEEAEAIACEIHRLIRAGCRYRYITIVVRNAESWSGILDTALEKEDIPCFISEKADIAVHPLIKLINQALRIKIGRWREEDVIGLLKTGLCNVSPNDINLFEEYASVWHPRGEKAYNGMPFSKNPDGFTQRISPRGERILQGANAARESIISPLVRLHNDLEKGENATALCNALYNFLEDLDIKSKLAEKAKKHLYAGERREAEELSRLYNVTIDALEDISNAIGDQKLTVSEFADVLGLVFSHTDIGVIPTSADEVVIGSAAMLRADHPRFVLVAGLVEGAFPQTVTEDGLFSFAEKERLATLNVEFSSQSEVLASEELFYIHRAFSTPRDGLTLFYSTSSTDGRSTSPSIGVERTLRLLNKKSATSFGARPLLERIYSPSGAMEHLPEWSGEVADEVLTLLKNQKLPAVKSLERPVVDPIAAVCSDTARFLFTTGRFNPTHLEKFSSCRFAYYCSHVLHLREDRSSSISSAEIGTFIHFVLEHVMNAIQKSDGSFRSFTAEKQQDLVTHICTDYRQALQEAGCDFTPRADALLARLKTLAGLIVSSLVAEFADSLFSPAFLELDLASAGERATVSMQDGTTIPLTGKADRVDHWRDENGNSYLRVADYKTGTRSFDANDIEKGFCLQMPLYLLALCRGEHPQLASKLKIPANTVFRPAGVTYLSSAIGTENTDCKQSSEDAMLNALHRLSREGLVISDPNVQNAMSLSGDKQIVGGGRSQKKRAISPEEFDQLFDTLEQTIVRIVGDMRSGKAEAIPHKHGARTPCDFCSFGAVCRSSKKSNA